MSLPATVSFRALGTTAVVVTGDPSELDAARAAVATVIADVDLACSRFRDDSELMAVNRADGRRVRVSSTLLGALEAACWGARASDGLVDPTIGSALRLLGYDRDFAGIERHGPPLRMRVAEVPGWRTLEIDEVAGSVRVPVGVELDLGATAKAWCADRAAAAAAEVTSGGVLVGLGGDIACGGPAPEGGWLVALADRHDEPADEAPVVAIESGGLATSGTAARHWWRGDQSMHHIVDPATGLPARSCWRTVSVAAVNCLAANVASTAAMILGPGAVAWLIDRRLPARLVATDGAVTTAAGWPDDAIRDCPADEAVGRRGAGESPANRRRQENAVRLPEEWRA